MIRLNSSEFKLISDVHRTIIATVSKELNIEEKKVGIPVDIQVYGSITTAYYQVGEYTSQYADLDSKCNTAVWVDHRQNLTYSTRYGELVLEIDNYYGEN